MSRTRLFFLLGICMIIVAVSACTKPTIEPVASIEPGIESEIPLKLASKSFLDIVELTSEEKTYLQDLQQKNILRIATRPLDFSYNITEDNRITGFNYLFAKSFADSIGVNLDVTLVNWNAFFMNDGVVPEDLQTDPDLVYTPDLLRNVDMYCEYMTILPWREKLFTMVTVFPVKQMIIKRRDVEISSIEDLANKRISIFENTSYHMRLKELESQYNIRYDYVFVTEEKDQNLVVSNGDADVSIQDSIIAIRNVSQFDNLEIAMPITKVQFYGWGIKKEDTALASILAKYINYAKASGEFDRIWFEEYGITHLEYLHLIEFE